MQPTNIMKRYPYLGFAIFLGVLSLLAPEKFFGPDYPIYPAYIRSVVEDGDLNIINNVTRSAPDQPCSQRFQGVELTQAFKLA